MKVSGTKIRAQRRARDYSQEYMALQLGISQKSYSDIENGKTQLQATLLRKISEILDVEVPVLCPLANTCSSDIKDKHDQLIRFLIVNSIDFPRELI
ncbi:helix-turn-helix domain-containing protein [Filimonas effusa]|uniref:XRE family transcriptional regulator n=1 Tax=Filimonas effusa TaxID=2508721 RepID=A0A4Q1D672_9BACT|nr:helix-turn-helix transcriptional regulator [Filimonas effusa]RXK83373.1 XRE family transcriptional regulator [Filimonas effusa]